MNYPPDSVSARINEIAVKYAPDYPNIEKVANIEKLWAIEQTLDGKTMALEDLHKIIDMLLDKFGMTHVQALELWGEKKQKNLLT